MSVFSAMLWKRDGWLIQRRRATALLVWLAVMVMGGTGPAMGTRHPLPSHRAAEIETLVNKAAEVLEEQGSRAFEEFRQKNSRWRYGDVYLFVVDLQGMVLFNAARPNREGHDQLHERDADGKRFLMDFIEVVRRYGAGWVDYMFPRPGQTRATVKWSYVCRTRIDGVEALVGAGVYVE